MADRMRTVEGMELMEEASLDNNFWLGKRVLVTGHTGFKGSWLSLWLDKLGARVTGISIEPNTKPSLFEQLELEKQITSHNIADIRKKKVISEIIRESRPDIVFHLAAQPLVRESYENPLETWETNLIGSLNVLEALKPIEHSCAVIMITTDKVYSNREWDYGYRECDELGGHDPYSASKAATELAIASWRKSFCGLGKMQTNNVVIATARAGNVIGGGDWAKDRIIPDCIRALQKGETINIRNPAATRPWQHVLEPLGGYLDLAKALALTEIDIQGKNPFAEAFNFGPNLESNRTVEELIETILKIWPGSWSNISDPLKLHEAKRLHLQIDKANHKLKWRPRWKFEKTVGRTVNWYKSNNEGMSAKECCLKDIKEYENEEIKTWD